MKILIVIDMQNDFISGALGNPETLAVLPNVCERVKEALKDGTKLLYTRYSRQQLYRFSGGQKSFCSALHKRYMGTSAGR